MAPLPPLGRARAVRLVRDGALPFTFGSPHPIVSVLLQDGVYRIRSLVVDAAEARASHDRALAAGQSWMAEHYYALGAPSGAIHVEAASIPELLAAMETMPWPDDW